LIFGMLLSASLTLTVARGQSDQAKDKKPDEAPLSIPDPVDRSKNKERGKEDLEIQPAQAGSSSNATGANSGAPGDSTSSSPPSEAAAAEPESEKTAVDRLPVGNQSVAVTVNVQAPASMNLNKEATLKLIVRNTGTSDALNVVVHDELPEGLKHISSQPAAHVAAESLLSWRLNMIPAGTERLITLKVVPTKPGSFDHAATVTFMTGCKSRTSVVEPKLKVDVVVNPATANVLKGQPVEFKFSVTNTGDGPARNVSIKAKLSAGLRHQSDEHELELMLPDLAQGQTEKLDPLVTTALIKGDQSCIVTATSPDVVFSKDEAENKKTITVTAPELKLALSAPESRYTDTVADYEIVLENIGSAPARKVRVLTTLPVNGRLVKLPKDADYDRASRRLQWRVDQLDPNAKRPFPFQVRMTGSGIYDCLAEATADGTPKAVDRQRTEVMGMPVIELDVTEIKKVLDVNGITTFQIRISNSGTKDATNLQVTAELSSNLKAKAAGDGTSRLKGGLLPDGKVEFPRIDKLGREKEMLLGIEVQAVSGEPQLATCRVKVKHDDLPDSIDDMAAVRVIPPGRTASAKSKVAN
jgi:uncharacterized repeat protein (TIGR01451 family)